FSVRDEVDRLALAKHALGREGGVGSSCHKGDLRVEALDQPGHAETKFLAHRVDSTRYDAWRPVENLVDKQVFRLPHVRVIQLDLVSPLAQEGGNVEQSDGLDLDVI